MPVTTRTAPPNYKIFEPDALDVALSNKVTDPLEGGIAGTMLLAHNMQQQGAQQQFTDQQSQYNKMAAGLEQLEMANQTKQERMKIAPSLLEHGTNAGDLLGIEGILSPGGIANNTAATMAQGLNAAKIAELKAQAAKAASGGGGGTKETTTETYLDPSGTGATVAHKYGGAPKVAPGADPTGSTPLPAAPAGSPAAAQHTTALNENQVRAGMAAAGVTDLKQAGQGSGRLPDGSIRLVGPKGTVTVDSSGKVTR